MKLDYDVVRALLIVLEDKLRLLNQPDLLDDGVSRFSFCPLPFLQVMEDERLRCFGQETVMYAALKLEEGKLIEFRGLSGSGATSSSFFTDISFGGHMLLKDIHDDTVWKKTKSVLASVGSASLDIVAQIASSVIAKQLNL